MKRIIAVLALLILTSTVFATNPTVTTTRLEAGPTLRVYEYSYTTNITNVDSAILGTDGGAFLTLGSLGFADSLFSVELISDEATADSVRHTVIVQATSASSPSATDWITVFTDASSFTNATSGHVAFRPRRLTSAHKIRIIVFENDTNKDATQNITARLAFSLKGF